jgi:hypothetical protein
MIDFKRARAYKSVHNAKLRFSLTVKVSEALIQARLWKCWVQIPQTGAGAKRRRVLVFHSHRHGALILEWQIGIKTQLRFNAGSASRLPGPLSKRECNMLGRTSSRAKP